MTRCPAAVIAVALSIGLAWVNTSARPVLLAADRGRTAGRESLVRPRRLRRRRMVPLRWYHGTFTLDGRILQIPVARGCPPLRVRLDRDLP
jgi:hypothetical protein